MNCTSSVTQCAVSFPYEMNTIFVFYLKKKKENKKESTHQKCSNLVGIEALTVLWWVTDRSCLNRKQTSIPLFLFSLRLRWLLLFVRAFVSGPSSCSTSIFACRSTVDESIWRFIASKLKFLCKGTFSWELPTLYNDPNEEEEDFIFY